jgi:hypothetical protein
LERECAKSSSKEVVNEHLSVKELKSQLGHHLASLVPEKDILTPEPDECGVVIPRLSPPPVVLGGKGTAAKPSNPPIRHVQFEISSSAVLKEDSPGPPGSLSRTSHSSTVDVLSSSLNSCEEVREQQMSRQLLAALNDDDPEDQQERAEKDSLFKKSLVAMETTVWLCGSVLGRMVTCSTTRALSPPATETNQLRHDISRLEEVVSSIVTSLDSMNIPDLDPAQAEQTESAFQKLVTRDLTGTLGSLLEHGLDKTKCVPEHVQTKGEFTVKMSGGMKGHWAAWKIFQEYYQIKGGDIHSSVPLHKLSSSFSLPVENGLPPKKSLLTCIHKVEKLCESVPPCDAPSLKLFCLLIQGFNIGFLKDWLHLVVSCDQLIERFYHGYSFVSSAGFRPAFPQLERLKRLSPHPTVDFHIQEFISEEAFQTS